MQSQFLVLFHTSWQRCNPFCDMGRLWIAARRFRTYYSTGGSSRNSGRLCFRYSPQLDFDKSAVGSPGPAGTCTSLCVQRAQFLLSVQWMLDSKRQLLILSNRKFCLFCNPSRQSSHLLCWPCLLRNCGSLSSGASTYRQNACTSFFLVL